MRLRALTFAPARRRISAALVAAVATLAILAQATPALAANHHKHRTSSTAPLSTCSIYTLLCLAYDSSARLLTATLNRVTPTENHLRIINHSISGADKVCSTGANVCVASVPSVPMYTCYRYVAYEMRNVILPTIPPTLRTEVVRSSDEVYVCGPRLG